MQGYAEAGALVLIMTENEKRFLVRLQAGHRFHCHIGIIEHDVLCGQPFGSVHQAITGKPFLLLEPTLSDLMLHVKRNTQVIYPKDAAWLMHRLGLRSGSTVLEAGTGSGALTTALAWTVAPHGQVITVEGNPDMLQLARQNLERFGLLSLVEMHEGYLEQCDIPQQVDAVMLDMREPWHSMDRVTAILKPGGSFACFLPTTNQVSTQLAVMEEAGCADIRVEEMLLRGYKPVPDRLRPEDRMIAHTGFLVSSRIIRDPVNPQRWLSPERRRFQDRQAAAARYRQRAAEQTQTDTSSRSRLPP